MRELPSWSELIARYGLKVRRAGASFRGPCPLHGGSNPTAFVISPGRGFFCHACGENGGLLRFLELMRDPEATEWAETRREGPKPDYIGGGQNGRSPARIRSQAQLPEVAPLSPLDAEHRSLRARGVAADLARAFGCGYFEGTGPMRGRIVFPIHDHGGRLVGHIGRAVGEFQPRYLFSRGLRKSQVLYNEHRVRAAGARSIVVVEGPFDLLAVHAAGWTNVVSTLGCQVSAEQVRRLRIFGGVSILFDRDDAGRAAARDLASRVGAAASIIELPAADPANLRLEILSQALSPT